MAIPDVVGAALYIGPADVDAVSEADYQVLVYTEIKNVETIPSVGPTSNTVKFTPLKTGVVQKKMGSTDSGDPEVVCFFDAADPGQLAAINAQAARQVHAFKMTVPDTQDATLATTFYWHAYVTSVPTEVGAADNVVRRHIALAITGPILEVDAA